MPTLLFLNADTVSFTNPPSSSIFWIVGCVWTATAPPTVREHSWRGFVLLQIPIFSPLTKGQFSTDNILFDLAKNISVLSLALSTPKLAPATSIPWNTGFCCILRLRFTLSNCFKYLAGSSKSISINRPSVIKTGKIFEPPSANNPV